MVGTFRPRRLASVVLLGALAFGIAACGGDYPNSTFNKTTDHNTDVLALWDQLLLWGTIVFVGTEIALIYTIFRFRRRPGVTSEPKQVHGNTAIEIAWTAIPAVILIFIAIPTVRTIFKTQAAAAPDALQIEVIGHQWWWEFRYPQYNIVTANEIYIPNGRTVNFHLKTKDVLHSFWVPQLGGKRDLITNRTNYLWFTPSDTLGSAAWNGFCAEYCGESHANMRFRTYTVSSEEFDQWVAHQQRPGMFPLAMPATGATPPVQAASIIPVQNQMPQAAAQDTTAEQPTPQPGASTEPYVFPVERLRSEFAHVIPTTRPPEGLTFDESTLAQGDAERGLQAYNTVGCIGCHAIAGNMMSQGILGPNLTHIGTRHTIGAGLYENTPLNLALWIKSSAHMKPGSLMPSFGEGVTDPVRRPPMPTRMSDQQIADIVAYLNALK